MHPGHRKKSSAVHVRSVAERANRCFRNRSAAADRKKDLLQRTANSPRHWTQRSQPASATEDSLELRSAWTRTRNNANK